MTDLVPATAASIPQPRTYPLIGNVPEIDADAPVASLLALAERLGPIFRLTLPGQSMLVLTGHALVRDACDEARFEKHVHGPLENIRDFAGDGLFTAYQHEESWGKAHRVLMPAFGPAAMKNYFADMLDIAEQMFTKWQRLGPDVDIDVPDAMTRLTLDTIALCGFAYRFNSFYQREMHPFVEAMVRGLSEAGKRTKRLPVQTRLMFMTNRQYADDARFMHAVTDEVIAKRRLVPAEAAPRDLLGLMLNGRDPITGEGLDDANIRNQLVTFLIAGHETTSGLLSFASHLLLEHPALLARARAEVDAVLGDETPRFEHIAKLTYIDQILRETLRLYPTAPAFAVHAKHDTRLGGRFAMKKGDVALALLPGLHRDASVWADPARFDPDRFAPERRDAIPDKAWLPFGNGMRACLGRSFALQEATLVLAMMLQRFDIARPAPYQLSVKETLTLKPEGLRLRARPRPQTPRAASRGAAVAVAPRPGEPAPTGTHATPLLVLYGSNSGASEAFARRIASDGVARGWAARVAPLDQATGALPSAGAVVVVTASYNGEPPDNARRFCAWAAGLGAGALAGVRFAVFGCGNRDWAATYQQVPQRLDADLRRAGATALHARGEADARADFFGDFERWYAQFWAAAEAALEVTAAAVATGPLYDVELGPRAAAELVAQNRLGLARVVQSRELVDMTATGARSKRHLELELPAGESYVPGDYLAVLPENHPDLVARAARHFGLRLEQAITLRSTRGTMAASLPTDRPVVVGDLFARYLELGAPATRRDVERLAAANVCPPHRAHLGALAADEARYQSEVLERRVSVLDLLDQYPSSQIDLATFLEMCPTMRVRQYSISSSPRLDARRCTLTVAIVEGAAWSGAGVFRGTASSFLARLQPGDEIAAAVRRPRNQFHPPTRNDVPMVLVAAGTGIAPFRGFLADRAARAGAGEAAGTTLLFFGCDHPEVDFLYRDELAAWQREGLVEVHPAFCRQPDGDVTFVQHRLWQERTRVLAALAAGAHVYVCGDGKRMAPAVRATFARMHAEAAGTEAAAGEAWVDALVKDGRYAADVFG